MVQYIIQIIAFQVFFLLVYDVFLKKETFFNWNRFYLIGTSLLSLVLPFVKVTAFKEIVPKDYIVALPEIFIGNQVEQTNQVVLPEIEIVNQGFSWSIETIFYLGLFMATLLFIFKIAHIFLLIYKNPKRWKGNVLLVKLINSTSAFSFFHYVFLGSNLKEEEQKVIIKHELVHVTQKHTLDLLFFEIQRIVFWFNPLVYMYQSRVRSLHEYIADQEALKTQDKSDYYQNLLTQVFDTQNVSFINAFFKKSLIKKRIVMLSKTKSKQIHLLKYTLLIPLVFGMLLYTSAEAQKKINQNQTSQAIIVDQDLSDEQLKEKLRKELKKMKAEGADFMSIAKAFVDKNKNYIQTKEDYYRHQIYYKGVFVKSQKNNKSKFDKVLNKTYAEYLEWKKTDEAKEIWENDTYDGVLKLVVNDLNNLSPEETKRFNNKKKLLAKDVYFSMLKMTDVTGSGFKVYYQPNEYSSANKRDESKALRLNETFIEVGYNVIDQVQFSQVAKV